METKYTHLLSLLFGFGVVIPVSADQTFSPASGDSPALQTCLQQAVLEPENLQLTIAELHQQCHAQLQTQDTLITTEVNSSVTTGDDQTSSEDNFPADTALTQRTDSEWFFTPYKDNYLTFGQMRMDDGSVPFSGEQLDTKFSLGLSFSLFSQNELLDFLDPLRFGYSQLSWWNIADDSSPFTEHNYNPEVYWDFTQPGRPLVGDFPYVDRVGLEHQSNGLGGLDSRSWDRIYAQKTYHLLPQLRLGFKLWQVIGTDWQNDDIEDYLGSGQVSLEYEPNDRTLIRFKVHRGHDVSTYSYQADIRYRRPWLNSAFFLSYYNGYGEALINYNQKASSVRLGLYFPLETF
ncbi:phospholipase A [Pseudohongiella nitratireducens]|jgi:phospholipase A1|uniref:phospholipase A n=1 Tax=Pseudohongiella nitratireducens TaxID=1768907 RepID=UPI00083AAD06|nr:phospholipase A [Pseudohongiella nitratireducens]MDF1624335.1 phospholipase A [Pseudohongiella nitratireducens]|tara:strand:+ start:1250 stop:2290 length:1041 start_codon:yes stop_codon:yes gene_type:complete